MFSLIWMRCVPRAHVSAMSGGRSGSASQPSTPPVWAWIQRSLGIRERTPAPARQASMASERASNSGAGTASILTA